MSIITQFPIPTFCEYCGGKLHKHGKRKRHVREPEKVWYFVQRVRCATDCGKTFTILLPNMLPYKHYAASEIEQVLQEQENPATPPHECAAEESTLYRWKREFPEILTKLASHLESLANVKVSLLAKAAPLQRVYEALSFLVKPPPDSSRLAWAFFVSKTHPVRLG